jgi:hypothetical protein
VTRFLVLSAGRGDLLSVQRRKWQRSNMLERNREVL